MITRNVYVISLVYDKKLLLNPLPAVNSYRSVKKKERNQKTKKEQKEQKKKAKYTNTPYPASPAEFEPTRGPLNKNILSQYDKSESDKENILSIKMGTRKRI